MKVCVLSPMDSTISGKGSAVMYTENFIEQVFQVRRNVELAAAFFPFLENADDYHYAHCIYLDGKTLIAGTAFTASHERPSMELRSDFKNYLNKTNPKTFGDFLLRIDLYDGVMHGYYALLDLIGLTYQKFSKRPVVDELLEMSGGLLLWHHQLESLFALFLTDHARIVNARRSINMKKPEAFRLAKSLKFDESLSLEDVILERMVLGTVKFPNIHGANTLYRLKNAAFD
jgi:hypothetical protein